MNHFSLPNRFIKSINTIINRFLQIEVIVIVVAENGVEFIISKTNDLTLRLRINKISIKEFKFTETLTSAIKQQDFKDIQKINRQFYKFSQDREQIKVFDLSKDTPQLVLQTIQVDQQISQLNEKWFSQIIIAPEIYQKIISESSFYQDLQDVFVEIGERDTRILCNNKLFTKVTQPSPKEMSLLLPRKAFTVFDILVSDEKQNKDVQLSLQETSASELSFTDDFVEVNIQFKVKLIDKDQFNCFIIEDGHTLLKVLTQFHKYIQAEVEFTLDENQLQIHSLDFCHVALASVNIAQQQMKNFKFYSKVDQTFPLKNIIEELKSRKKVGNLQIKINQHKLIICNINENKSVEVTSIGKNVRFNIEDQEQTEFRLQKSDLVAFSKQFRKNQKLNTDIEVKKDSITIESDGQIAIQNVQIVEKSEEDFKVSLSTKYLGIFVNLNQKNEGEIAVRLGKGVPALFKEYIHDKFVIKMYLAPKIQDDD